MIGITYRNKHSRRDIGVVTRTVNRPVVPPVRSIDETIPYRDGTLDYSELDGRLFYDDKILEIEIAVVKKDLQSLHKKISKVISWICGGYGDLIFDDMPYVVWIAKPIKIDGIAPELQRVGKTTVQFRCHPFNRLYFDSTGVALDSDIQLDDDIKLGYGDDSDIHVASGDSVINIDYIGTAPVSPQIIINGEIKAVKLSLSGRSLLVDLPNAISSYDGIILDCEGWRCLGCNGDDLTRYTSGDFLELRPGSNTINITVLGACDIQLVYYPNYMYGDEGFNDE